MDISNEGIVIVKDQKIEYVNDKFIEFQTNFIMEAIVEYVEVDVVSTFMKFLNKIRNFRKPKEEMTKCQLQANKALLCK